MNNDTINSYTIKITDGTNCFTQFNKNSYIGMMDFNQFKEYFFPNLNLNNNIITNPNEKADIFISGININFDNKNEYYNNKINILICIENITNPKFSRFYSQYIKYKEYGDKRINLYIYNHISKIIISENYIAIPCIHFRINYFKLKYNEYFNHPEINTPFSQKKMFLRINRSKLNKNIDRFSRRLAQFYKIDDLNLYNNEIGNKSLYNSIEFLKVLNQYKFIICFENSYNDGYITEKIFNCFFAKTLPIYSGSPKANYYFNENSFIYCDKTNFNNVLDKINQIINNEELYNSYINSSKINQNYDNENYEEIMMNYITKFVNK